MATLFSIWFAAAVFFSLNHAAEKTITDVDGNTYKTVQIGNQVWMAENLEVSRYRNGDTIPFVTKNKEWETIASGAWSAYNNDTAIGENYGNLYNWYAVNDPRGICPKGWHIPSDREWDTLSAYLGGEKIAGEKMKPGSIDATSKISSHNNGFNAVFAGYRSFIGKYVYLNNHSGFWSSTEGNPDFAWIRYLNKYDSKFTRTFLGKRNGISCRCVKDEAQGQDSITP